MGEVVPRSAQRAENRTSDMIILYTSKGTAASDPVLAFYKYEINNGNATGVSITNATLGNASESVIDGGTGVTATQTNYCAIRVSTNSTSNRIHGGYIKIETV